MSATKYDLLIHLRKRSELNTAGSKAVLDCSALLDRRGYRPCRVDLREGGRASALLGKLRTAFALARLYRRLPRGAIVGMQYPPPVMPRWLAPFLRASRRKGVRFFCIVHDLISLRAPTDDAHEAAREARALNEFDHVVVHNPRMRDWLERHGTTAPMSSLDMFDYLVRGASAPQARALSQTIVFAGNLAKSGFVRGLGEVQGWRFRLYGPGMPPQALRSPAVRWLGECSPEEIVDALDGDFGLVWDGPSIDGCHDALGRYLQYNNPHKLSLYVAAGLPVIVPANAAVAPLVERHGIGLTVASLRDLARIDLSEADYQRMRRNVATLRERVVGGEFLLRAVDTVEAEFAGAAAAAATAPA